MIDEILKEATEAQTCCPYKVIKVEDAEKLKALLNRLDVVVPDCLSWIKNFYVFKPFKPFTGVKKQKIPIIPVFTEPIEICDIYFRQVLRIVPVYPQLAVSEDGKLVSIKCKKNDAPKINVIKVNPFEPYPRISYRNKTIGLYVLIALAWIPNDDYVTKNTVDHIDAKPTNNNVNNLRWVSQSLNAARASNKKLEDARWLVKKIGSDEIYQFTSLKDAANFLGKDKRNFSSKKCPMVVKTINGGYILEDKLNFKNWELEDYFNEKGEPYRYIVDGEKFVKLIDVIRRYNLPLEMKHYRKDVIKDLESMGHEIKVLAPERIHMQQKHIQCITVEDIVNGTIQKFKTKKEVLDVIGIPITSLNVRLRKERLGQIYKDRWLIYWCGHRPKPKNIIKRNQPIKAFNTETKEERLYPSLRRAAASLEIDRRSLKRALENNKVLKNWKFEYIE